MANRDTTDWDFTDYYGNEKNRQRHRTGDQLPENEPTCIAPWTTITLHSSGDIKPCCTFKGVDGPSIHQGDTLESAWKGMTELRRQFINKQKPDRCINCWKAEAGAGKSRRQWLRDKIHNIPKEFALDPPMKLRHMDLNFGNTCNLKCRMCGSWGSTHWLKEDRKLMAINKDFKRGLRHNQPLVIKGDYYKKNPEMFDSLERIDFKGGEPFMQDGMYEILEFLVESNFAKDIVIGYTTNGTKTPEKLKDLWPHFKRVVLNISVEATGDLYKYIRGSNLQSLDDLEQNIYWYDKFDNVKGHFSNTVNIYSIFDLQNLAEWMHRVTSNCKHWKTLDPARTSESLVEYLEPVQYDNLVKEPNYLDINNMPPNVKKDVLSKWTKDYPILRNLRKMLSQETYNEHEWELFKQFTIELDRMRKTDIKKVLPELAGEFNGSN